MTLTDVDLEFLAEASVPDVKDRGRLKALLREDEDFRNAFLEDERTFRKVVLDREIFLRISPPLYFEILLRRARWELAGLSHTIERDALRKVAVFDAKEVADLLSRNEVLSYLTDMLSSFARIHSYSYYLRMGDGPWRRLRFNDMDIGSLSRASEFVEEEHRLAFYKRIADICLFVLGVFPEHVQLLFGPGSPEPRPPAPRRPPRRTEDFIEEGRKFYRKASEHPAARTLKMAELFRFLHDHFLVARKPLNFISERYISLQRGTPFGD